MAPGQPSDVESRAPWPRLLTDSYPMLIHLLAAALCSPAQAPTVPQPAAALACVAQHGELNWFPGSYEEALARAASEKKIVFIDFWTKW